MIRWFTWCGTISLTLSIVSSHLRMRVFDQLVEIAAPRICTPRGRLIFMNCCRPAIIASVDRMPASRACNKAFPSRGRRRAVLL